MKTRNLIVLLILWFVSCQDSNAPEKLETEINPGLYQLYPELEANGQFQEDTRMVALLHELNEMKGNVDLSKVDRINIIHSTKVPSNQSVRTFQNDLWQKIMNDTSIVIVDIILPTSFFSDNSKSDTNGRTMGDCDCDCVSTATGNHLSDEVCGCDCTDDSNDTGSSDAIIIWQYPESSNIDNTIDAGPSGGGGGITSADNISSGHNESLILYPASLELVITQDPGFYDKLNRSGQLSISEAMYWNGWKNRIDELDNQKLVQDILTTSTEYNYLYNFGRDNYEFFKEILGNPMVSGVLDYEDRSAFIHLRKKTIETLKGEYMMAILNPETIGIIISLGMTPTVSNGFRPRLFNSIARYSSNISGKGYSTFNAFKSAHGTAGTGKAWHHIVEQNKIGQFSASQIHNTKNLVVVEAGAGSVHARITGYYGSIQRFTNGQTVRNWMNGKSYAEQMEFGLDILYRAKNGLPLP